MDVLFTASTNLALRVGGEDPHTAESFSLPQVTWVTMRSPHPNPHALRRRPHVSSPLFFSGVSVTVTGMCVVETIREATEASRWSQPIPGFHRCVCACMLMYVCNVCM